MLAGTCLIRAARPTLFLSTKSSSRMLKHPQLSYYQSLLRRNNNSRAIVSSTPISQLRLPSNFHASKALSNRRRCSYRLFHRSIKKLREIIPQAKSKPSGFGTRLKKLSREYGWSAFGVYLALSALDFPLCYLLVRYLGADKIGEWEHSIVSNVKDLIPENIKESYRKWSNWDKHIEEQVTDNSKENGYAKVGGNKVEETEEKSKDASLATQLALAYAIHKSFIFIRVPITAALTPRLVKILRNLGWDIGRRTTKEAKKLNIAAIKSEARESKIKNKSTRSINSSLKNKD